MRKTLVILTRNEIGALKKIWNKIPLDAADEILAVDYKSTDGTKEFLASKREVATIHQEKPGRGEAMRLAAESASSEVICFFSPDGNEDPQDIPKLFRLIEEGNQLVIASRFLTGSRNEEDGKILPLRAWANRIFTFLANLFFDGRITDSINGFRAINRDAFQKLNLDADGYAIEYQMSIRSMKAGYKIAEIPTREGDRLAGKSKAYSIPTGLKILSVLRKEIFKGRRSEILIVFGFLALFAVFLILRVPFLGKELVHEEGSIWAKEASAIAVNGYPYIYVGEDYGGSVIRASFHKPGFFQFLLALAFKTFGSSDIVARSFMLFLSSLLFWLIFLIAGKFFGTNWKTGAFLCLSLFALSPFFIQTSIQVHPDGLVTLLATLFLFIAASSFSKDFQTTGDWIRISLAFLPIFATNIEISLLVGFAVFIWLLTLKKDVKTIFNYFAVLGLTAVFFFVVFSIYQVSFGRPDQILNPVKTIISVLISDFQSSAVSSLNQPSHFERGAAVLVYYFIWNHILLIVAALVLLFNWKEMVKTPFTRLFLIWFLGLFIIYPVLGYEFAGFPRYFAPADAALLILIGYFFSQRFEKFSYKWMAVSFIGSFVLFYFYRQPLFLERKLSYIVKQPLTILLASFAFWVILFILFASLGYFSKINRQRIFAAAWSVYIVSSLFLYYHDVQARYSLNENYGQWGYKDAAGQLNREFPRDKILLTDSDIGYYFSGRYIDWISVVHSASTASFLESSFKRSFIGGLALSDEEFKAFEHSQFRKFLGSTYHEQRMGTNVIAYPL